MKERKKKGQNSGRNILGNQTTSKPLTRLQIGHSLVTWFLQYSMSANGLWMFFPIDILTNVRPLLEILVGLFVILIVFVKNADVDVETARELVIFAER